MSHRGSEALRVDRPDYQQPKPPVEKPKLHLVPSEAPTTEEIDAIIVGDDEAVDERDFFRRGREMDKNARQIADLEHDIAQSMDTTEDRAAADDFFAQGREMTNDALSESEKPKLGLWKTVSRNFKRFFLGK